MLECIPNVSEGRRPEVVAALTAALEERPGVRLLDHSSDPDHDRSVFTLAGEADALHDALLGLFETALAAIDLARTSHGPPGVHPRMGAVDVVPFVPLAGSAMADAVAAARRLGRAVAERFELPVLLYEEAASAPERRNLAQVRRGGFEGLAEKLALPEWAPDFGPARPHPSAGAVAVGARRFLIAFNAVLATDDLEVARAVARAVRESSGGLPAVKAIGVPLASRGRVQVSMNLVDYRVTSPAAAMAAVERAAAARGVEVEEGELVGLMPEDALLGSIECTRDALRLGADFGPDRIVERRL